MNSANGEHHESPVPATAAAASGNKPPSGRGRTLAIGDIHGCLCALDTLLTLVGPTEHDVVITLGDYIDRGPDSRGVLDRLLELGRRCEMITLLGNHEQMMLEAAEAPEVRTSWLMYGGLETLASYRIPHKDFSLELLPAAHREFLQTRCRDSYATDTHLFVHAGFDPALPLDQQPADLLRWDKLADRGRHVSGKTAICGHTRQISGQPLDLGHTICIDTWVYGAGWLTCLDVSTRQYWQANQRGETRTETL